MLRQMNNNNMLGLTITLPSTLTTSSTTMIPFSIVRDMSVDLGVCLHIKQYTLFVRVDERIMAFRPLDHYITQKCSQLADGWMEDWLLYKLCV